MEAQPSLGAILQHGSALHVSIERIRISFPEKSFFGRQAAAESARSAIATAAESVLGAKPLIEIVMTDQTAGAVATVAQQDAAARDTRKQETTAAVHAHPAVQAARKVFQVTEDECSVLVDE
jgi:hypothetical protein